MDTARDALPCVDTVAPVTPFDTQSPESTVNLQPEGFHGTG